VHADFVEKNQQPFISASSVYALLKESILCWGKCLEKYGEGIVCAAVSYTPVSMVIPLRQMLV